MSLVSKAELKEGIKLITKMRQAFKPKQYPDTQISNLKTIIAEKVKLKTKKKPAVKKPKTPMAANDNVVYIMRLLKESLKK